MTDARDRLAQGLEILMARPYNYWHLKEAADAIAAFVEERIGERDVAILDQTGRDLGVRVDALTQRLEAVERRLQHGLSCCCPLCRKSWGWTPCENHGVERCSACYPEQPAPAMLAALKACDAYFNQTRSGREWRDNGGSEPLVVRAAITQAEAGRKP